MANFNTSSLLLLFWAITLAYGEDGKDHIYINENYGGGGGGGKPTTDFDKLAFGGVSWS